MPILELTSDIEPNILGPESLTKATRTEMILNIVMTYIWQNNNNFSSFPFARGRQSGLRQVLLHRHALPGGGRWRSHARGTEGGVQTVRQGRWVSLRRSGRGEGSSVPPFLFKDTHTFLSKNNMRWHCCCCFLARNW